METIAYWHETDLGSCWRSLLQQSTKILDQEWEVKTSCWLLTNTNKLESIWTLPSKLCIVSISFPNSCWDEIVLENKSHLKILYNHHAKRYNQPDYSVKLHFYRNAISDSSHRSKDTDLRKENKYINVVKMMDNLRQWALTLCKLDEKNVKNQLRLCRKCIVW